MGRDSSGESLTCGLIDTGLGPGRDARPQAGSLDADLRSHGPGSILMIVSFRFIRDARSCGEMTLQWRSSETTRLG